MARGKNDLKQFFELHLYINRQWQSCHLTPQMQ